MEKNYKFLLLHSIFLLTPLTFWELNLKAVVSTLETGFFSVTSVIESHTASFLMSEKDKSFSEQVNFFKVFTLMLPIASSEAISEGKYLEQN